VNAKVKTTRGDVLVDLQESGKRVVPATIVGDLFAVHRPTLPNDGGNDSPPVLNTEGWAVTHAPTGRLILILDDYKSAVALARKLAAFPRPWLSVDPEKIKASVYARRSLVRVLARAGVRMEPCE
jgi:hypothetical protein